jgi:hypothetical protein
MKHLYFFICLSICIPLSSQEAVPQIFIKMNWEDSLNTPINLGHYSFDEDFDVKIKTLHKGLPLEDTTSFTTFIHPYLEKLKEDKSAVLFYIHGYSADSEYYQKFTNSRMQKHVYSMEESPYGLIVNLVWDRSKIYTTELTRSKQKGVLFAQYLRPLFQAYQDKFPDQLPSIISHSMGNRILEGLFEEMHKTVKGLLFHTTIMACPDLEYDALHRSSTFSNLDSLSKEVILYVHNNDRVLTVASQSNKIDRLGHKGPENWDSLASNITIVDASLITDNKDLGSKFSNHRYFYTSNTGREDLIRSLGISTKEEFGSREVLDRPFRFVIQPKEHK